MNSLLDINNLSFNNSKITIILDDKDEPWFKAKDVATVLEYSNSKQAVIKNVEEDDKTTLADLNSSRVSLKGAFDFLVSYTEDKKLSKVELEAMKTYDTDDSFPDHMFSSEEEEKVVVPQVVIKNPIITFVKEYTTESPNGKTNKKELYNLYLKESGMNIDYKEFNKNIRELFKFGEKKSHNVFYWAGITILK